jgi:hypothetical protein
VVVEGFDTGISVLNSDILLNQVNVTKNRIGLRLLNSESVIQNSNISDNEINIISENSSVQVINTITENVIDRINEAIRKRTTDADVNEYSRVRDYAQQVLRTQNPQSKRNKFNKLIRKIRDKAKEPDVAVWISIIALVVELWNTFKN